MGGGFGVGAFGLMPFGGGGIVGLYVVSAQAASLNSVVVTFSEEPRAVDPVRSEDALNPSNWTLEVLSPSTAIVRLAQHVEVTATLVTVFFDGKLTPRARYRITASDTLENADDSETIIADMRSADFTSLQFPRPVPVQDSTAVSIVDIANPQMPRQAGPGRALGTFATTAAGTLELDSGLPNQVKRCVRRITTRRGSFLHLPDYGVNLPLKGLLRANDLRKFQQVLELELQQEPDTAAASVTCRIDPATPGVVYCLTKVRSRTGVEQQALVPITLTEI